MISIIAAYTTNRVIGNHGNIPWKLPADMQHFRRVTTGNAVIMGRRTYEAFAKALPSRRNIVISRKLTSVRDGFELVGSLDEALQACNVDSEDTEVFIIGGAQLYQAALDSGRVDNMYLTEIDASIEGDTYFPAFDTADWIEASRKSVPQDVANKYDMTFVVWLRIRGGVSSIELA
jgi:dihydrofolate reductase